jgi:hypothetical protein
MSDERPSAQTSFALPIFYQNAFSANNWTFRAVFLANTTPLPHGGYRDSGSQPREK